MSISIRIKSLGIYERLSMDTTVQKSSMIRKINLISEDETPSYYSDILAEYDGEWSWLDTATQDAIDYYDYPIKIVRSWHIEEKRELWLAVKEKE